MRLWTVESGFESLSPSFSMPDSDVPVGITEDVIRPHGNRAGRRSAADRELLPASAVWCIKGVVTQVLNGRFDSGVAIKAPALYIEPR